MAEERRNWIVSSCCSGSDGVYTHRVYGTEEEVRRHLISCLQRDISIDRDKYDYGAEKPEEIEKEAVAGKVKLNAYATFSDYHIDYTAVPEDQLEPIDLSNVEELEDDKEL